MKVNVNLTIIFLIAIFIIIFHYYNTEKFKASCDNYTCSLDDQIINTLKYYINIICPTLKNVEIYSGKESVTVDKNIIYICLRDKNNIYYSMDILLYVTLHEVAHKISKSYSTQNHNEEFQNNFNKLLELAHNKNLFSDKNINIPNDYCKNS